MSLRKHLLTCCFGDQLHIYNCSEGQLHLRKNFTPFSRLKKKTQITDFRWNHNNMVLISCCDRGLVSINRSKTGGNLGMMPQSYQSEMVEPLHCLCLSSGSRYLATGGTDMVVKVWDLKQKSILKRFTGHAEYLSSLMFCHNDRHITSSSDSGEILLHDVFTSEDLLSLTCKTGVNGLDYSRFYPSLCCSGEKSGRVSLWDVEKESVYHQFKVHEDECKEVSFSRINHMLLVSIGRGGRLVLYDVKDRKEVQVLYTGNPLHSLAFLEDGRHIACGTENGEVIVYDVNNTHRPLFIQRITKKKQPVTRLRFQIFDRSNIQRVEPQIQPQAQKESVVNKKETVVQSTRKSKDYDHHQKQEDKKIKVDREEIIEKEEIKSILESSQVLGDEEIDEPQPEDKFDLEGKIDDDLKVSREELEELINSTRPSKNLSVEDEDQQQQHMTLSFSDLDQQGLPTVVDDDEEEDEGRRRRRDKKKSQREEESTLVEDFGNLVDTSPIKKSTEQEEELGLGILPGQNNIQVIGEEYALTKVAVVDDGRFSRRNTRREENEKTTTTKIDRENRKRKSSDNFVRSEDLVGFMEQMNLKFDDFKGSVHNDIQNLHVDVLRQFHLQQQEMASMIQKLNDRLEKVLAENEKLKEENYVFKNMY